MFKHAYSSFARLLRFDLVRASRIHPLHLALPISLPMILSTLHTFGYLQPSLVSSDVSFRRFCLVNQSLNQVANQ